MISVEVDVTIGAVNTDVTIGAENWGVEVQVSWLASSYVLTPLLDHNGDPVLDHNGDPIMTWVPV